MSISFLLYGSQFLHGINQHDSHEKLEKKKRKQKKQPMQYPETAATGKVKAEEKIEEWGKWISFAQKQIQELNTTMRDEGLHDITQLSEEYFKELKEASACVDATLMRLYAALRCCKNQRWTT